MDATASRQPSWDLATRLHHELFNAAQNKNLTIQLVYYRGLDDFIATSWCERPSELKTNLERVFCLGGTTQITRVLRHARHETIATPLNAVAFVGDSCEEPPRDLYKQAGRLGLHGVPVFMFQEGQNALVGSIFAEIARRTNGAHFPFDAGSAKVFADLLTMVATYASGGVQALSRLQNPIAAQLLRQLK